VIAERAFKKTTHGCKEAPEKLCNTTHAMPVTPSPFKDKMSAIINLVSVNITFTMNGSEKLSFFPSNFINSQ
jgi:hypothetical protein